MNKRISLFNNGLLVLLLLSFASFSFACSCSPKITITQSEIENVDVVFEGTIESVVIKESSYIKIATFKITKKVHGVEEMENIEISTSISSASCGLRFEVGQKWFIFSKGHSGRYSASICGRNVIMDKPKTNFMQNGWKGYVFSRKYYKKAKKNIKADERAVKSFYKNEDIKKPPMN
jgi:hypothetical protein